MIKILLVVIIIIIIIIIIVIFIVKVFKLQLPLPHTTSPTIPQKQYSLFTKTASNRYNGLSYLHI
jgi:hypothetical protein